MAHTDLLYLRIARNIGQHIKNDVLKAGDKLPSLRTICDEYGVSMSTALEAYHQLEKKDLIEARPQSGYYVTNVSKHYPPIHETTAPEPTYGIEEIDQLIAAVNRNKRTLTLSFSSGMPSLELLPVARLNKAIIQAMRDLPGSGILYDHDGNVRLKRQIARRTLMWGGRLKETDIIPTSGCMEALAHCMIALTRRGDTIAVESPVFYGILQLARNLGLNVLELPTNATTGVELDALKTALRKKKVKLCLLISNFSNPLGSCMPDEHKREAARLMEEFNVPLIEDDLYGDLYFGNHRPACCKTYDEAGMVLWCGSFSKTLAPGYRVGWVAPGRFKEQLERTKSYHAISSNTLAHEAVGYFLEHNRYDNHLRKLRAALHANSRKYLQSISTYFPEGTRVSRPEGGFVLWVALHKKASALRLYDLAIRHKMNISPGQMFTLQKQYRNCFRLSTGMLWNEQVEAGLKLLGKLAMKIG